MTQYTLSPTAYHQNFRLLGNLPDGRVIGSDLYSVIKEVDANGNIGATVGEFQRNFAVTRMLILSTGTMLLMGDNSVSGQTEILRSTDTTYNSFEWVHTVRSGRILERGADKDENDNVLYVEYSTVSSRTSVPNQAVVRGTNDGRDWVIVHDFNRAPQFEGDLSFIRHIHTVCYDPYEQTFWIGTGDSDHEAKVFKTPNGENPALVGEGDQMWRSVSFEFYEDCVVWGGDATGVQNYMIRYDRQTQERDFREPVAGPIYITQKIPTRWGDFVVTSTCVEDSPAEWDDRTHVHLNTDGDGLEWPEVISWQKSTGSARPRLYTAASNGNDTIFLRMANIVNEENSNYPSVVTVTLKINEIKEPDQGEGTMYEVRIVENIDGVIKYSTIIVQNNNGKNRRVRKVLSKPFAIE